MSSLQLHVGKKYSDDFLRVMNELDNLIEMQIELENKPEVLLNGKKIEESDYHIKE